MSQPPLGRPASTGLAFAAGYRVIFARSRPKAPQPGLVRGGDLSIYTLASGRDHLDTVRFKDFIACHERVRAVERLGDE